MASIFEVPLRMDCGDGGHDGYRCSCHSHQGIHGFSLVSLYRERVESYIRREKEVPGVKIRYDSADVKSRRTHVQDVGKSDDKQIVFYDTQNARSPRWTSSLIWPKWPDLLRVTICVRIPNTYCQVFKSRARHPQLPECNCRITHPSSHYLKPLL